MVQCNKKNCVFWNFLSINITFRYILILVVNMLQVNFFFFRKKAKFTIRFFLSYTLSQVNFISLKFLERNLRVHYWLKYHQLLRFGLDRENLLKKKKSTQIIQLYKVFFFHNNLWLRQITNCICPIRLSIINNTFLFLTCPFI